MTCQIILRNGPDPRPHHGGKALLLSCTCAPRVPRSRPGGPPAYEPIEARTLFPAAEAIAAWRAWHAERGVAV